MPKGVGYPSRKKLKDVPKSSIRTPPGCLPGETAKECRDRRKAARKNK